MGKLEDQLKAKYGEEEGTKRYLERKAKQSASLKERHRLAKLKDPLAAAKNNPRSKYFYISRGYTEAEAKEKLQVLYNKHSKSMKKNWDSGVYDDRILPTNKEYYINQGLSEEEAIKEVTKYQKKFSKEICIEKYGEEEGLKIWQQRQDSWQATLNAKSDEEKRIINKKKAMTLENFILRYGEDGPEKYQQWKDNQKYIRSDEYFQLKYGDNWKIEKFKRLPKIPDGFSKISQKLFWAIIEDREDTSHVYFGELNKEFAVKDQKNCKAYIYDFVDTKNKKCIEFNGDIFHGNPNMFKETDTPNPYNKNLTAKEIWDYDKIKVDFLKEKGYNVMIVWESDFRCNPKDIIKQCKEFIGE